MTEKKLEFSAIVKAQEMAKLKLNKFDSGLSLAEKVIEERDDAVVKNAEDQALTAENIATAQR